MGDKNNRSGGPLDTSIGCSGRDLTMMGDGGMKRRLEDIARIVEELRGPVFLTNLASMGLEVTPPSDSHIIVLEAVIILLTPQVAFENHVPMSPLKGVTWTEVRHILGFPDKMWAAIARVDAYSIPPAKISTLQVCQVVMPREVADRARFFTHVTFQTIENSEMSSACQTTQRCTPADKAMFPPDRACRSCVVLRLSNFHCTGKPCTPRLTARSLPA